MKQLEVDQSKVSTEDVSTNIKLPSLPYFNDGKDDIDNYLN